MIEQKYELKEGIVLDQDGNALTLDPTRRHFFIWNGNGLLTALIVGPLIIVFLALGLTLFLGFAAATVGIWLVFAVFRFFFRR